MGRCRVVGVRVAALAVATLAACSSDSVAGTYVVRHCANGTSMASAWTSSPWIPTLLTYSSNMCAVGQSPYIGVSTYGKYTPVTVPVGSRIDWTFRAPESTRIVGIVAQSRMVTAPVADVFDAQVWDSDTGETLFEATPQPGSSGFPGPDVPLSVALRPTRAISFGLRCNRPVSCVIGRPPSLPSDYQSWWLGDLSLQLSDSTPPTVRPVHIPGESWQGAGAVPVEFLAEDNVGIRELRVEAAGREIVAARDACYLETTNTVARPCDKANSRASASLSVESLPEGRQQLGVSARDPGGLETTLKYQMRIDRTPPVAPRGLQLVGAEGWRSTREFEIQWAAPPGNDDVAPLVGNEYEFCPETNLAYDVAGCVRASSTFSAGATRDRVTAPGEGAWTLRMAHRDAAGNTNPANATSTSSLRFDASAPSGEFEPFDPRDPTRIRLHATDAVSGVATVEVEARRAGESTWHALTVEGGGGRYSAVLDDSLYPKGSYDVRARVFDLAGNEKSMTHAPGGTAMRVGLPVRVESRMTAGRVKRMKKSGKKTVKRVLDARPIVDYGRTVTISGRIADPTGNPRARVSVDVSERVDAPARPWGALGSVQTTAAGTFSFRVPAGASRTIRFSYGGSATTQPAAKEIQVRVRAAATIRPDRRRLRNGDEVVFRGRVRSGPVPEAGKLVTLQALTRRGWTTFGNARARAKDGRWSYRYRFTGTTVRSRYSFRVVVPAESGFPYAQGTSDTTRVLVQP